MTTNSSRVPNWVLRTACALLLVGAFVAAITTLGHLLQGAWAGGLMKFLVGYAGLLGAAALAYPLFWVGGKLYDLTFPRLVRWQKHLVRLAAMQDRRVLAQTQQLLPTETGLSGHIITVGSPRPMALDSELARTLVASQHVSHPDVVIPEVPSLLPASLPEVVSIQDVLGTSAPSLSHLTVGVCEREGGGWEPVYSSLHDLMHLLAVGVTGTGKSTWLLSFLYQIARVRDPIEVLLIDTHGSAFNLCERWDRLRYPIARDEAAAIRIMEEVYAESERRKVLYRAVPLAEDLASYNAHLPEGAEPLAPWLTVIDEGLLLLNDHQVHAHLSHIVSGTRQYGLYVFMTGQSGKASVIETEVRSNFTTRMCFSTEKPTMRAVLGDLPEKSLRDHQGRAWLLPKGRTEPTMIQAPYVLRPDFLQLVSGSGPRFDVGPAGSGEPLGFDARVQAAWDNVLTDEERKRKNKSAVCRALGEKTAGGGFTKVNEAGKRLGLW